MHLIDPNPLARKSRVHPPSRKQILNTQDSITITGSGWPAAPHST